MNWEEIRKEYETTNATMAELANKHGVKPTTLRSRKNREKWVKEDEPTTLSNKGNATQQKNATQRNSVATPKTVEELNISNDIADKQRMFCLYYIQSFNATQSYIKAYDASYSTAMANGYKLLRKAHIQEEIARLKEEIRSELQIEAKDITLEWAKQAFTDISDYLSFGTEEFTVEDDNGDEKQVKYSAVRLKDSDMVDASLIQEISQGKDGVKIKLVDKQRALQELAKRIEPNQLDDELTRARINKLNVDATISERKAESLSDKGGKQDDKLKRLFEVIENELN